jgi:hypothetical protein
MQASWREEGPRPYNFQLHLLSSTVKTPWLMSALAGSKKKKKNKKKPNGQNNVAHGAAGSNGLKNDQAAADDDDEDEDEQIDVRWMYHDTCGPVLKFDTASEFRTTTIRAHDNIR